MDYSKFKSGSDIRGYALGDEANPLYMSDEMVMRASYGFLSWLKNKTGKAANIVTRSIGTATITAESRSGKTATIIYTVRQATSSIKINVKVYKPVTQLNDKNQVITDVEGITLAGDTRPTSCRVKLQEAASKEFIAILLDTDAVKRRLMNWFD